MVKHESEPVVRCKTARRFFLIKWSLILLVVAALIPAIFAFLVTFSDLFGPLATPEKVVSIERERETITTQSLTGGIKTIANTQSSSRLSLEKNHSELIPDSPDLPHAIEIARKQWNSDFQLLQCRTRDLSAISITLDEKNMQSQINDLSTSMVQLMVKINTAGRGNKNLLESIRGRWSTLCINVKELEEQNWMRHGQWKKLALNREYDNWDHWPEAVYYWRRHGGWEGYWRIFGGSINVRTRNIKWLAPLRRILPYEHIQLSIG